MYDWLGTDETESSRLFRCLKIQSTKSRTDFYLKGFSRGSRRSVLSEFDLCRLQRSMFSPLSCKNIYKLISLGLPMIEISLKGGESVK